MTGDIRIYGEVGKHVTFQNVMAAIDPKKFDSYDVHIMSPGGDVFDGYAIYNALKNTGKPITVYIEGLCASIATLIAAAGDKIIMNKQSQFMIHNPMISGTNGDATDLRNVADQLDKIKTQLIDVYQKRTNLSMDQLWAMYDKETWLTPEQAKEMGFVDEVAESLKAVATAKFKPVNKMKDTIINLLTRVTNLLKEGGDVKNQIPETLQDGTTVVVLSEDGDFTGKQIVYEDGTALPDGNYTLASGKILVVSSGVITEVQDAPMEDKAEKPDALAEATAKLEAANAEIANLKSALEARNTTAVQAEAKAKKFENMVKTVQTELEKIKNTSVGGDTAPDKGIKKNPNTGQGEFYDPMGEMFKQNLRGRNLIED